MRVFYSLFCVSILRLRLEGYIYYLNSGAEALAVFYR